MELLLLLPVAGLLFVFVSVLLRTTRSARDAAARKAEIEQQIASLPRGSDNRRNQIIRPPRVDPLRGYPPRPVPRRLNRDDDEPYRAAYMTGHSGYGMSSDSVASTATYRSLGGGDFAGAGASGSWSDDSRASCGSSSDSSSSDSSGSSD